MRPNSGLVTFTFFSVIKTVRRSCWVLEILHLVIQNQKRGNTENSQTKYPFIQLTLAATTLFALSLA